MSTYDWIDIETVRALKQLGEEGGQTFLNEVIALFIDNTPPVIGQLDDAVRRGDTHVVKLTAHRLKGFSGNLGLTKMIKLCTELERQGAEGYLENANERVEQLWQEFEFVRDKLTGDLRSLV